jgi:hypothetical protein
LTEPITRRTEAEAAVLRVTVLRLCLQRKPVREIAEELRISTAYVAELRKEILAEVQAVEITEGKLLLQLEIEATREDLRRLQERQAAHPSHGYDLFHAKLAVQERLLKLQGHDVGKAAAVTQINIGSPGAALAMQAVPTIELQRLLDEVTGVRALPAGEGEAGPEGGPSQVDSA